MFVSSDILLCYLFAVAATTCSEGGCVSNVPYYEAQRPLQVLPPWLCLSRSLLFICPTHREVPSLLSLRGNKGRHTKTGLPLYPGGNKAKLHMPAMEWQVFHGRESWKQTFLPLPLPFSLLLR